MKTLYWIILGAVLAVTLIAQLQIDPHYWWDKIPGFFAVFGFVGCMLIMFAAKALGYLLVSKKPDYYKENTDA
ncbi:MAG: hypothetical protein ACLFPY_03135 [Desulfonatronovibrio sp.]